MRKITINEFKNQKVISSSDAKPLIFSFTRKSIDKELLKNTPSGIYILFNTDKQNDNGGKNIYVGESSELITRIEKHKRTSSKDWFDAIIIIVSSDMNDPFNKSEQYFYEEKFIELFMKLNYEITNSTKGTKYIMSSIERKSSEFLFEWMYEAIKIIEPNLMSSVQTEIFDNAITAIDSYQNDIKEVVEVHTGKKIDDKIISDFKGLYNKKLKKVMIRKGSWFIDQPRQHPDAKKYFPIFISRLLESKAIKLSDEKYTFIKDNDFMSPSMAAYLAKGGPNNGWTSWIDNDNKKIDIYRK